MKRLPSALLRKRLTPCVPRQRRSWTAPCSPGPGLPARGGQRVAASLKTSPWPRAVSRPPAFHPGCASLGSGHPPPRPLQPLVSTRLTPTRVKNLDVDLVCVSSVAADESQAEVFPRSSNQTLTLAAGWCGLPLPYEQRGRRRKQGRGLLTSAGLRSPSPCPCYAPGWQSWP